MIKWRSDALLLVFGIFTVSIEKQVMGTTDISVYKGSINVTADIYRLIFGMPPKVEKMYSFIAVDSNYASDIINAVRSLQEGGASC